MKSNQPKNNVSEDNIFAMIDWLSVTPRRVILKSFTNNKGRIKYRIGFNLFSAFWN